VLLARLRASGAQRQVAAMTHTGTLTARAIAVLLALAATACAGASPRPTGFLTSKDLSGHWIAEPIDRHPMLDIDCESIALDPATPGAGKPVRVTKREYIAVARRQPDEALRHVAEFVLRFDSPESANESLRAYKDAVRQCLPGGDLALPDDEAHIVQLTGHNVLTEHTSGVAFVPNGSAPNHISNWLDYAIDGDRAVWLMADGGTQQQVEHLIAQAIVRARTNAA
jgi:hypothetical protein